MKHIPFISILASLLIQAIPSLAQTNPFGYTTPPDTTSASTDPVGSINGSFAVSPLGAATYTIPIECPQGLPGMTPQVAITYNSQAGNGVAGYGCSISGISVITRVPRDIFHDGAASGISYTADDAFSLDGQRLILTQAAAGSDSAVYCLENDPYMRIVLHGLNGPSQSRMWFSTVSRDGMSYEYGTSATARRATEGISPQYVEAWYVCKATNPVGNYIEYEYVKNNLFVYPSRIIYGRNTNGDSILNNCIEFGYSANRPDIQQFRVKGCQGKMEWRLNTITSHTGNDIYRCYQLQYHSDLSDQSHTALSRLKTVTVQNGDQEHLQPVTFDWNFLQDYTASVQTLDYDITQSNNHYTTTIHVDDTQLMAADFNGDGISDIVQKSKVSCIGNGMTTYPNHFYIRLSGRNSQGEVTYGSPNYFAISGDIPQWLCQSQAPMVSDIDGDGKNDLIVPYMAETIFNCAAFSYAYGKDMHSSEIPLSFRNYFMSVSGHRPLYATGDLDGDGMSEVVILETGNAGGTSYHCNIFTGASENANIDSIHFTLNLPGDPRKLFIGDYNADGLPDLLVAHSNGYKIFWNGGGSIGSAMFASSYVSQNNMLSNAYMLYEGDFNGDGLTDFLTTHATISRWIIMQSNGDGTFTQKLGCVINAYKQGGVDDADEGYLTCQVYDMDGDGKSDAFVSKAMFNSDGSLSSVNSYRLYSNGVYLVVESLPSSSNEENAAYKYCMVGDFDGDGIAEMANYGYNYDTGGNRDTSLRIYDNSALTPASGRVKSVADGFGKKGSFEYRSLAEHGIYTKYIDGAYPCVDAVIPLSVVSRHTDSNGTADSLVADYEYGGMKVQLTGKGLLGLSLIKTRNDQLGRSFRKEVQWNTPYYVPSVITETQAFGQDEAQSVTQFGFHAGTVSHTYFPYLSSIISTDPDNNVKGQYYNYDFTKNGVPTRDSIWTADGYASKSYSNYAMHGGQYLPHDAVTRRKYRQDAVFSEASHMDYTAKGLVSQSTCHANTQRAVTTEYSYDLYGNMTASSTHDVANSLESVTKTYEYDYDTHRFITKSTERGYIVKEYTHDLWGNVLTETDKTRPAYPQTTRYTYDGWGNLTLMELPAGQKKRYTRGWDGSGAGRYFVVEQGTAMPWVKTIHDGRGRVVCQETIGAKELSYLTTTEYNQLGKAARVETYHGNNRICTDSYQYDQRGRLTEEHHDSDPDVAYSYGNRSVTTSIAGRSSTETRDSWGNIVETTDPAGTVTAYQYGSHGKPLSVTSCGATVTMGYDAWGNQTSLTDPDAGTMAYTYDAYGRVKTQRDGRGNETSNEYDGLGRLYSSTTGGVITAYTYGQTANDRGLLLNVARGSNSISYAYDSFGRTTQETRSVIGLGNRTFQYEYGPQGTLAKTHYPGGLTVSHTYDSYGNRTEMSVGNTLIWAIKTNVPYVTQEMLGTNLTHSMLIGSLSGRPEILHLGHESAPIDYELTYDYDVDTYNMTRRSGMFPEDEFFTYDNLDRLTCIEYGNVSTKDICYAPNGNITTQTDIGRYYYEGSKPHAVTAVDNTRHRIPTSLLQTQYNAFGKVSQIRDFGEDNYKMLFDYGPDNERWRTRLYRNTSTLQRTTYYMGDYEEIVEGGTTRRLYYLGGNVLYKKQTSQPDSVFYLFTDHLGSVVLIVDQNGGEKFSATYDAWGNQTVTRNDIKFHRGYTGHEMLPEFGLINMNGRLYDPAIGRFLSTDNYVQEPWNSQNFNRYSYCLNNPLKYTDSNGEIFTWLFGSDGFSIGLNFGFFGFGLNFGYENFSVGIYGELGPRVGGTGFGAGATISQSLDYSLPNESFSTSTSLGVYGSLGLLNVGANTSYTYGNNGGYSWNVNAGVNIIGTDEEGLGLNVGYGSNGWNFGIGGFLNPNAWDDNPEYEPDKWNNDKVLCDNNCYSYALDEMMDENGLQPGYSQDKYVSRYSENYNSEILELVLSDGRIKKPTLLNKLGFGKKGYYELYLIFGTYIDDYGRLAHDYHWYRQDKGGLWSHKPGYTGKVKRFDASGSIIKNPVKANHHYEKIFYNKGGMRLWARKI